MKEIFITKLGIKGVFVALVFLCSSQAFAAIETAATTTIKTVGAYTQYGNGDVTFTLQTHAAQCLTGYFLKSTDPGFKSTLALIISAYTAGSKVAVSGHTTQMWPGSAGKFCKLYSLSLVQ